MSFKSHGNVKDDFLQIMEEFLGKFVEEQNFCTKAVALHSFTKSYFQVTKDNIEQKRNYSSNVFPKVPELFAELTQFNNLTTYNAEREVKALNLQSATLCLETFLIYFECFKTNEHLLSLLQITLKVLFQAYTHCEMSECLYGDLFEDFTDQMATFYQRIQDVQTAMVSQIDRLITTDVDNADDILLISDDLGKLCKLVSGLDTMIAAKLWRAFVKLVTHFSSIVRGRLEVNSVLTSLIDSISNINQECVFKLTNLEQIEETNVKILLFELNQVMKIFHLFRGCLEDSIQKLRNLVLEIYKLLIICHSIEEAKEINVQFLKSSLLKSISPMISLFYSDKSFLMSTIELNSTEISCDYYLPRLFLTIAALKFLSSNASNLVTTNQKIALMKRIFKTLQQSKPNDDMLIIIFKLPETLFGVAAEGSTTMYVELYHCISEFSKIIPGADFNKLESDVSELLLSSSDVVSLLISDVWIYRLRCSSTENLYSCCKSFSQLIMEMKANIHLKLLFQRMLKFLPANKKQQLLDCNGDLKCLLNDSQMVLHRYGVPQVFETPVVTTTNYKTINSLITELRKPVIIKEKELAQKALHILELFSLFVGISKNEDILKFSEFATILLETEIYEIQIAVLTFLKAMREKQLTKNSHKFSETVHSLSMLLVQVLKSSNYIVRHEALNTYSHIAHSTPHPEIIRDIIIKNPELTAMIKSYFSKIPSTEFLSETDRMKTLQDQLRIFSIQRRPQVFPEKCKVLFQLK